MGKDSAIEWTDHTWNPWVGCFKVSPGCKNCYMYREQKRYGNDPKEIRVTKSGTFSAPLKWAEKDPGLVFTSSWTDFFLAEVDQDTRNRAWNIIQRTPQNTYQVLTKRIENVPDMLPDNWGDGYDNVWLGVSVENQEMANLRIPLLLKILARVRFLSVEPLLGSVDLTHVHDEENLSYFDVLGCSRFDYDVHGYGVAAPMPRKIHLVIVGGESGPNARPMDPQWAIDIKDQCGVEGVPFFMKQMGGHPNKRAKLEDMPIDLQLREFPRTYEDRSD